MTAREPYWPQVYSEDIEVTCETGNHLVDDCDCQGFDDNNPFDQMLLDDMRGVA